MWAENSWRSEVDDASNRTRLNTSTTRPYSNTIVYRNLPELAKPVVFAKKSVPNPILETPEVYAQQIFKHFYALFVPREKGIIFRWPSGIV